MQLSFLSTIALMAGAHFIIAALGAPIMKDTAVLPRVPARTTATQESQEDTSFSVAALAPTKEYVQPETATKQEINVKFSRNPAQAALKSTVQSKATKQESSIETTQSSTEFGAMHEHNKKPKLEARAQAPQRPPTGKNDAAVEKRQLEERDAQGLDWGSAGISGVAGVSNIAGFDKRDAQAVGWGSAGISGVADVSDIAGFDKREAQALDWGSAGVSSIAGIGGLAGFDKRDRREVM